MKKTYILANLDVRHRVCHAVHEAPDGFSVTIGEPSRSLEQNSAQWPVLEAFAAQLQWPVNGKMVDMTADEWKDVLTAAFHRETVRLAMGLDGGVVMLGQRTSAMGKKEFSEWLDFLKATAADRGVNLA